MAVAGLAGSQEGIHNVLTPVTSKMGAKRKGEGGLRDAIAGTPPLVPAGAEKVIKPYTFAGNHTPDSDKVRIQLRDWKHT